MNVLMELTPVTPPPPVPTPTQVSPVPVRPAGLEMDTIAGHHYRAHGQVLIMEIMLGILQTDFAHSNTEKFVRQICMLIWSRLEPHSVPETMRCNSLTFSWAKCSTLEKSMKR